MHDSPAVDRAENFTVRIAVTVFKSHDPAPDPVGTATLEFARHCSFDEYTTDGTRDWIPIEVIHRNTPDEFTTYVSQYAEQLEETEITTTSPPPTRVCDSQAVVAVRRIPILAEHIVSDLQLTFDVDVTNHVARFRESIDLQDKWKPITADQEKIDDAWDDIGLFLHHDLEWVTARLPTPEAPVELAADED